MISLLDYNSEHFECPDWLHSIKCNHRLFIETNTFTTKFSRFFNVPDELMQLLDYDLYIEQYDIWCQKCGLRNRKYTFVY